MNDNKSLKDYAYEIYEDFKKKEKKLHSIAENKCPDGLIRMTLKNPNIIKGTQVKYFTDFLDSSFLKYLSRDEFKTKLSVDEQKSFYGENDLLKFIYSNDSYGLIIYGHGGIGKTRLMLELGKRLLNNDYIVLEVRSNFGKLEELINYLALGAENKYVLLFDYIEEQKVFDQIVQWLIDNKKENIKIIANCRNTVITNLEYLADYLKFIHIDTVKQLSRSMT